MTKTETTLVIWLNIVTIVARSVRHLPECMREDVHATHQLHCQSWAGQCHAKHAENAAHAILIGVILNDLERFCVTCKFFFGFADEIRRTLREN